MTATRSCLDDLPPLPGAYLLMLHLPDGTALPPRFNGLVLPEGLYAYAGSAYGSGGIRARCCRHLRQSNVRHWHVDWLTSVAKDIRIATFPDGGECALIKSLSHRDSVRFPVPGFGSSDCRQCVSHLVQLDAGHDINDVQKLLDRDR